MTAHARWSDPVTSHAAAKSLSEEKLRESQEAVLGVFRLWHTPMDDPLMIERYRGSVTPWQSPSGLRTRRKELVDLGYLEDSGERFIMPSGRKSIVWRLTDKGSGRAALLRQNMSLFE